MRRVVVTGLGHVAPTGNDVRTGWTAAVEGRSGIARITLFDVADAAVQIAGEVKGFDPVPCLEPKEARRTPRFIQFAASASAEAVRDAGLTIAPEDSHRAGCSIGAGLGGLRDIEDNTIFLKEKGPKFVSPFFLPYTIPNMAAGVVSRIHNLRGPNICTTTACASGTHGIGEAYLYITNNLADVMVAGGTESAVSPLGIAAFASMKALSKRNDDPTTASRPFDVDRDGFVMGEGAGILVLEELEKAKKRGACIYAEVVGYGMSGDAHHITAPAPDGEGAQRCMRLALDNGRISPSEIDHINAHGTSTKLNDIYESIAIGVVFGDHARKVSISSTKGVTGHCLGGAGGIEAVYTVKAVEEQVAPPTANLVNQDPECPWDYTPREAKRRHIHYAMSNSFGFGGTNATIIFKRFEG